MSKEHSDQDTRLTPSKLTSTRTSHSIAAETRRALQHYAQFRKDELQRTKQEFLQRLNNHKSILKNPKEHFEEPWKKERKEKKKKKREIAKQKKQVAKHKAERHVERRCRLRRTNYWEPSQQSFRQQLGVPRGRSSSNNAINLAKSPENSQQMEPSPDISSSIELNEEGPFEIKPIHESILDFQKTIDNFLDYQCVHRKRRTVALEELFQFLKTTKYGLSCQKYFRYLREYNRSLYQSKEQRVGCGQLSSEEIQRRLVNTRLKMTHKEIAELLI